MADWRANGNEEREEFLKWAAEKVSARQGPGSDSQRKYGDEFRGEPVAQLVEENLDSLFYAYFAEKKERWLQNQIELLSLSGDAQGTVLLEAVHENLQRALNAEKMLQKLHDKMDDLNANANGGRCHFCGLGGYNAHGLIHDERCVMVEARRVLEKKG